MRGGKVHPVLMPALAALALSGLIVLVSISQPRTQRTALLVPGFQVPEEPMKGAPFMADGLRGGLPAPYSEGNKLGNVQYMPMDSMSWYPDQPAEEGAAGEEGAEEPAAEEPAAEEPAAEEPAAESAAGRPTILKSVKAVNSQRVADPVEWAHQQRFNTLATSLKKSPQHSGSRKIPDPIEWLTGSVMARKNQKQLAHTVAPAHTAKLHETPLRRRLNRISMDGRFNMPTKATLQEAQERAKVLGCSGVHYLPGPGSTFTAAPCKSQSAELSKLQGQRFTNRDDVGTSVKGASTDLDGTEFRNAWNGFDAADAADSSFLSAKKSATHSVTPSWEGADDADDALLQSRTQAVKRHQHPGAQNLKWHSW